MLETFYAIDSTDLINRLLLKMNDPSKNPDWQKQVGEIAVSSIKEMTAAGKDVDGRQMEQYSDKPVRMYTTKSGQKAAGVEKVYVPAKRDKPGAKTRLFNGGYREYKQETFGDATPNMRNTGKMMEALIWKKRRDGVEVTVRLPLEKRIGAILQAKRKWFGLGRVAKEQIIALTRKILFGRSN